MLQPVVIHTFITIMEAAALFSAALSGFVEARKQKLDAISTFIVGFASAFGGGTIRDLLLDRRPFYWVAHQNYAISVLILAFFAPLVIRLSSKWLHEDILNIIDAIGLGLFTIAGTSIALDYGMPYFSASLLGAVTGVFGGVVRDIFLNRMPWLLSNKQPYVSCAYIGSWLFIGLYVFFPQLDAIVKLLSCSLVIVILRLIAYYKNLSLDLFLYPSQK